MERKWCSLFLMALIFTGCLPEVLVQKMPSNGEGAVIVYLQPMPQEANKLRFIFHAVNAIGDDGAITPLDLFAHEVKGAENLGIQKRLAQGFLLPGSYNGLSISIKKAFVDSEEGESALLVPDTPVFIEGFFKVIRKQATTLFLSFTPRGFIENDIRFTPDFLLEPSTSELVNLIGYVTNSASNNISVFNKIDMAVVDTIATGQGPRGIVLDQGRRLAYVAVSGDDAIEVIDLTRGSIVGRLRLRFQDQPVEIAMTPDGRTIVSVNRGSDTASIIDALSLFERARINVGKGPSAAVIHPSGLKAFILNASSNTVSVLDLTQHVLSATLSVEGAPLKGDFNGDGDELYIIHEDSPYLTVLDSAQLVVKGRITIGMGAMSIKVDSQTDLILVGKKATGEILIVDPFASMPIDAIGLDGDVAYMAIDKEENRLFAVLPEKRVLQKINLTSKRKISSIELAEGPYGIVLMGQR